MQMRMQYKGKGFIIILLSVIMRDLWQQVSISRKMEIPQQMASNGSVNPRPDTDPITTVIARPRTMLQTGLCQLYIPWRHSSVRGKYIGESQGAIVS